MNEKELKFKYEIGEIVGVYKILEHWREKNKNNGKSRKSNTRVFYECQCIKCGHILERSRQEYLDSVKNNSSCVNCIHINMDNFRFDIGEKINDRLVIINKFREKGLRIYQYKCEKDGYIGTIPEQNILNTKIKCPVCTHCKLVTGLNDFNTLYPQYARFLINSKDGDNIGVGENAYADFICPHCGRKLTHVNIRTIVRYGYIPCIYCGKGHSNAEKLMSIILMDNGVNFIPQKKFKE